MLSPYPPPGDTSGSTTSSYLQPFRVLVVENEPFTRLITKAMLKSMGFQPVLVSNGERALQLLRSTLRTKPFELVLITLQLPLKTGPQVLAEMQVGQTESRPSTSNLHVLSSRRLPYQNEDALTQPNPSLLGIRTSLSPVLTPDPLPLRLGRDRRTWRCGVCRW